MDGYLANDPSQLIEIDLELCSAMSERRAIISNVRVSSFTELDQLLARAVETVVESLELQAL